MLLYKIRHLSELASISASIGRDAEADFSFQFCYADKSERIFNATVMHYRHAGKVVGECIPSKDYRAMLRQTPTALARQ